MVIDQVGGYAGGQELLELFENGVFSRARETALRTTILPPRARWIGLFLRTRCNRQSSRSHCIIAKERPSLQAFRDWVGELRFELFSGLSVLGLVVFSFASVLQSDSVVPANFWAMVNIFKLPASSLDSSETTRSSFLIQATPT